MLRLPTQQLARQRARCRRIGAEEHPEPIKVLARSVRVNRRQGHVEELAECTGDVTRGNAFFGDSVKHAASRGLVYRQPNESARIQAVHCWPPILTVVDVRRPSLLACD